MNALDEKKIQYPYCGEIITVLIDYSLPHQNYIKDCQVWCRPINFDVSLEHDGEILFLSQMNMNKSHHSDSPDTLYSTLPLSAPESLMITQKNKAISDRWWPYFILNCMKLKNSLTPDCRVLTFQATSGY